ncbi:MAG: helix-turn-helix domain-containing protein [Lachnospiraceae bacterium]|nr:helix-turn-helix domain-containing protein [Lachnospiraceae bacterium]
MEKELHEINQYKDLSFPVEMYRVSHSGMFPRGRGLCDYHWHEELQFTMIRKGTAVLQVNAGEYRLREGEAVLVGSGMIHAVTELSMEGEYVSINFPYRLLSFFPGSRMETEDVLPYAVMGKRPVLLLRRDESWKESALQLLDEMTTLFQARMIPNRAYAISVLLVRIWLLILENHTLEERNIVQPVNVPRQQRMQVMLAYLYEHYGEELQLSELATVAHVSVGECCRTFQECLHTTPYQFLKVYRIRRSTELLQAGHTVTEAAMLCGFRQTSNYITSFKTVFGCTPLQYKKYDYIVD